MAISSVNNSSTAALSGLTSSSNQALSDANAAQDRFLKLLVSQLQNQDPMNPMDNAQMTSQMAQINTVTGINQLNETMKSMSSQFISMQILQGSSMVGNYVAVDGNTMSNYNGVAKGAFNLAGNADSVTVEVMTPGGQLLDKLELGPQTGGRQTFSWDASEYNGQALTFSVSAKQGTQTVSSTPEVLDTITSVSNENGLMNMQLRNGNSVPYSAVKAIF